MNDYDFNTSDTPDPCELPVGLHLFEIRDTTIRVAKNNVGKYAFFKLKHLGPSSKPFDPADEIIYSIPMFLYRRNGDLKPGGMGVLGISQVTTQALSKTIGLQIEAYINYVESDQKLGLYATLWVQDICVETKRPTPLTGTAWNPPPGTYPMRFIHERNLAFEHRVGSRITLEVVDHAYAGYQLSFDIQPFDGDPPVQQYLKNLGLIDCPSGMGCKPVDRVSLKILRYRHLRHEQHADADLQSLQPPPQETTAAEPPMVTKATPIEIFPKEWFVKGKPDNQAS